ncbi:MAG: YkgJ family cysteine cluster protein [Pseudomonadota bacterium]
MVDIDRPSTWTKFEPSLCGGCHGNCCKLHVEAKVPDLVRMGLLSEGEALWSAKKIARKLESGKIIQSFTASTMKFTIAQRVNRDCIFLDERTRLCTIYDVRPDVCRNFPEVGPRPGWCPETRKGKSPAGCGPVSGAKR